MIGALDVAAGTLVVDTSRTKRSSDFIALLTRLDELDGPRPGRQTKPVVLYLDQPVGSDGVELMDGLAEGVEGSPAVRVRPDQSREVLTGGRTIRRDGQDGKDEEGLRVRGEHIATRSREGEPAQGPEYEHAVIGVAGAVA